MIVDALAVVGIGKKSVAARSIGLTEGEAQGAVHIAYRRIGRCRLAEPSSLPGIILIKREAVFRQLHTFFYFRLSLRRLRIEEFIELMQFFDTQVISSFLCRFPAGSQENQQRQKRQENLPEAKLIFFHHFYYFLQVSFIGTRRINGTFLLLGLLTDFKRIWPYGLGLAPLRSCFKGYRYDRKVEFPFKIRA